MKCRFFPTIAEIREKAEPFWSEWKLKNQKLIEGNALKQCPGNVWWDDQNIPHCRIGDDNPEKCLLAGTGMCMKWEPKVKHVTRDEVYGVEPEMEQKP